ncbi:MAG: hypothetical protein ACOC38_05540, partial [Promethearchaeia archaeon]
MSTRPPHSRILLLVALGILLVISMPSSEVAVNESRNHEHDSFHTDEAGKLPIGHAELSESGDIN